MPQLEQITLDTMAARLIRFLVLALTAAPGIVVWTACVSTPAAAQEIGRVQDQIAAGTAYRVFARPGDATVQVVVVADQGSGVYEVASDTDLGKLVALTGGFAPSSPQPGRRTVTVRLLRQDGPSRKAVYAATLDQLLLEPGLHPELVEGDVLAVETVTKSSFSWRDMVTIGTALTTLTWTLHGLLTGN